MPYRSGGTNITELIETAALNDARTETGFTTSNYRYQGWNHRDWWGTKVIMDYSGYIYSGNSTVAARFLKDRTANWFSIARKGCRPFTRQIWNTTTPNTYFVNRFSDGEVWVSTTANSRTGTRISTTSQNIKYLFTLMIAGGGGGGGGSGTTAGGGGGGGSFLFLCHQLVDNWLLRLFVGEGGTAGARNTDGGTGGQCQTAMFRSTDWSTGVTSINIFGGGGGRSGGNNGTGGSGGSQASNPTNNSYIHIIDQRTGMSGGNRNNAGSSSPNSTTASYNPENSRLSFGSGTGGNAGSSGGGGGSGWYFGANHKGGDGGGTGADGGIGAGGGGGAWVIFAGNAGGKGGGGYAALFY